VKSKSSLIATTITSDTPRVPKYSSHTNVQRNILSADDEQLKFIPYLGDVPYGSSKMGKFKRLVTELEEAYTAKRSESSREYERASQIRSYLDSWLERLDIRCDQEVLIQYILVQDQEMNELNLEPRERNSLLKSFPCPLSPDAEEIADMFCQAFNEVFKLALGDVILPGHRLKDMVDSAIKTKRASIEKPTDVKQADRLGTYATLTCLICGAVDCQTHGDYGQCRVLQPDDSNEDSEEKEPEYQFEHTRFVMNYEDMIRRHKARKAAKPPQFDYEGMTTKKTPCGEDCWMKARDSEPPYSLPTETVEAMKAMLISITNKITRSCTIAFTLDLPCWQVYRSIELYEETLGEQSGEEEESSKARPKRPDWYDNKRKVLKGDWMDMTSAHLHQERCQANPVSDPDEFREIRF
jgi:ssRNA-specific RNase YbeY (16S rRNA maturation enzyme)